MLSRKDENLRRLQVAVLLIAKHAKDQHTAENRDLFRAIELSVDTVMDLRAE